MPFVTELGEFVRYTQKLATPCNSEAYAVEAYLCILHMMNGLKGRIHKSKKKRLLQEKSKRLSMGGDDSVFARAPQRVVIGTTTTIGDRHQKYMTPTTTTTTTIPTVRHQPAVSTSSVLAGHIGPLWLSLSCLLLLFYCHFGVCWVVPMTTAIITHVGL